MAFSDVKEGIFKDAISAMKKYEPGKIDLVVTTLPSGDGLAYDDYLQCLKDALSQVLRIMSPAGAAFLRHKWTLRDGFLNDFDSVFSLFPVRQIIILNHGRDLGYEVIYFIAGKDFRLVEGATAKGCVWNLQAISAAKGPEQIEIDLAKYIISSACAESVTDPFCDVSVEMACQELGKRFVNLSLFSAGAGAAGAGAGAADSLMDFSAEDEPDVDVKVKRSLGALKGTLLAQSMVETARDARSISEVRDAKKSRGRKQSGRSRESFVALDKIVCGDALAAMEAVPSGSIDLVITSPPYNLRAGKRKKYESSNTRSRLTKAGYDNFDDAMPQDKYIEYQRAALAEMLRIVKETGHVYYIHKWAVKEGLMQTQREILVGFPVRQVIIRQAISGNHGKQKFFVPNYEVIYVISSLPIHHLSSRSRIGSVWSDFKVSRENDHPASFPVQLVEEIICLCQFDKVLRRKGVIYDPFMGSGSTALAARNCGQHYGGSDLSPLYVRVATERLLSKDLYPPFVLPLQVVDAEKKKSAPYMEKDKVLLSHDITTDNHTVEDDVADLEFLKTLCVGAQELKVELTRYKLNMLMMVIKKSFFDPAKKAEAISGVLKIADKESLEKRGQWYANNKGVISFLIEYTRDRELPYIQPLMKLFLEKALEEAAVFPVVKFTRVSNLSVGSQFNAQRTRYHLISTIQQAQAELVREDSEVKLVEFLPSLPLFKMKYKAALPQPAPSFPAAGAGGPGSMPRLE